MELELWLDESGDFISDNKEYLNPSLVGGVLVEKDVITQNSARNIIGKDYIHYNEESGTTNMLLLEKIQEANGHFVIFQNKERVQIIDGDTTYLNVLAEGIIQLLLRLSALYGDFKLHILIATRKNVEKGYGIIEQAEYETRLRERIIVGLARKVLTRKSKWHYTVEFGDARDDVRLMLADGVCNTYLTQTSSKFNPEQKARITELYKDEFIFSFFEHSTRIDMEQWLAEGNLSDVIFENYLEPHEPFKQDYLIMALNHLSELDDYGQHIQLQHISSKIETFIKIDRNFQFIRPVLIALQDDLLPKLDEHNIHVPIFHLDIILYLYSLYTHKGSTKAIEQDRLFMDKLNDVKDIMVKFDYFNKYKLRRSINEKNHFNITGAIDDSTKAITILDEMVQLLDILDEDNPSTTDDGHMFETLGKAYGTRGQCYTMLIHENETYLDKAITDFNHALQHFSLSADRERQFIYQAHAYSEAGQFDKALHCLFKSCGLKWEKDDCQTLLRTLKQSNGAKEIFKYHTYFKIMAQAELNGETELARMVYQALHQEHITIDQLENQVTNIHPIQFILWHMATYLFSVGRESLANTYINKAIERCESPISGITIKVIQLGMIAEKLKMALTHDNKHHINQSKQQIVEAVQQLKRTTYAEQIFNYLGLIEENELNHVEKLNELIQLTRCIN